MMRQSRPFGRLCVLNRMTYLFVYGTLRRGYAHPVQAQLARQGRWLGAGWLRGRLYDLGGYPGFVPAPDPRTWVQGDVYELAPAGTLLAALDAYEESGLAPGAEYVRRRYLVRMEKENWRTAWVYVYNWPVPVQRLISSGDYLAQ
jgi:gamma-glutamylcyclotransferase (GGCT)/AIG2-like uncharacterized protein YtfP